MFIEIVGGNPVLKRCGGRLYRSYQATIKPVERRISLTLLADICPNRFQLASLTDICFSVRG
ncbi:MAG: hypothetical protein V7L26_00845 [Nostoc sp.]